MKYIPRPVMISFTERHRTADCFDPDQGLPRTQLTGESPAVLRADAALDGRDPTVHLAAALIDGGLARDDAATSRSDFARSRAIVALFPGRSR